MLKIVDSIYVNQFNDREAIAEVCYGPGDNPTDYRGFPLTQDTAKPDSEFTTHLNKMLVTPMTLTEFNDKSPYKIKARVSFPNASFIPAIIISRRDNKPITPDDKREIHKLLSKGILSYNGKMLGKTGTRDCPLPKQPEPTQAKRSSCTII